MTETLGELKEIYEDFSPLFRRMDGDADLYNMLEYKLRDLETKAVLKDVVNITMNDPKVFADKAIALLSEANMQTLVNGKNLQDSETTLIEKFDADTRYEIDMLLMPRGISGLYAFLIEQACIRGTLGARYVTWEKDGEFIPDLLPCDSRYLLYEYGTKNLSWAAFKTVRTKSAILAEYPKVVWQGTGSKGGIWEEWDTKKYKIWLTGTEDDKFEGELLKESDNIFGYVPFVVQGVGVGSYMQDANSMVHRNESIFAPNRLLYEHLNMLGSILQTLNYMTFNTVHLWESQAGTLAKNPPKPGIRKTIAIDPGTKGLYPMQVQDVNNATRLFYSLLLGAVQRGSFPNTEYGNLTFPLSAVALEKLKQTKNAILIPILNAIAWFYRKLHYMIRDQYVQGGYQAELGEEGGKRVYDAKDLDIKYGITYKFHSVSPEQDIANYAVAQQAMAVGMSRHTVYTNILKLENPSGEIMKGRAEQIEKLDPIIGLYRYGHALIDQGTEESFLEAELVADQIELLIKQRYTPAPEALAEANKETPSPKSMIPLLPSGGGGDNGAPANELEPEAMSPQEMLNREERRAETVRKQEQEG